jgi:hypothetical protein
MRISSSKEKAEITQQQRSILHYCISFFRHCRGYGSQNIIKVLASHDISAGECAGYSAAAGELGAAVNAALSDNEQVSMFYASYIVLVFVCHIH